MKHERVDLLDPRYELDRANQPGRPAGIFWLGGRCVMACHGTDAEARLLERGAVHFATLRFEPGLVEGSHPGRPVETLGPRAFLQAAATASG